jgi:hypothetical protein
MSFLVDPPLLITAGALIERNSPNKLVADTLEKSTLAIFIGTSANLYLDKPHTKWMWKLMRAKSGRDWMINSDVFHFEYENPSVFTHMISILIFSTYPFWIKLGRKLVKPKYKKR